MYISDKLSLHTLHLSMDNLHNRRKNELDRKNEIFFDR